MSLVFQDAPKRLSSWQCLPFESSPEDRMAWIEEQIQEAEGYLSGQSAYRNLQTNMRVFDGIFNDKSRSTLCSNFLRFNIRKFVETLSDVREIGLFGSDAVQYKAYAEIENRVAKAIYTESQFPRQLRKTLQYASVMGVGYLWAKCKTEDYGFGERRIIFEPLGLLDVLPVQVPSTNDVQDAYAVTVYEYMPIAEAHSRFPLFQSSLVPVDRMNYPSRLAARRLDWAERFRYGSDTRSWGQLYCEIRYTFIRDLRLNNTGHELPMGDPDTSWFYKVPSIGQSIFGGIRNGQPFMRSALDQDCRVYPNLRLMISNPSMNQPMYDGPAYDWHGKIPVVQYTVDDWPWEAMGLSLVDSVRSIEQTKRKHERKIDQVLTTRLDPPMGYDRSNVGGPKIEQFDLFEPNIRMGMDGTPANTFQSILPAEVDVTEINSWFLDLLKGMEEQQLGINDLGNLMNMRLNLDSSSMDKALESVGPIAKGIATSMEAGNAKIAFMLKTMVAQWMDAKRIIEYVGPDQITPEQYDFDPASLVPSHMADEMNGPVLPFDLIDGVQVPRASMYSQLERARIFARNLRVVSVPSTLLKLTQMEEQLKYLQLYRGGFPISPHTVAKKLGIDNYGDIAGDTEFAKFVNWKKAEILLMAEAQQLQSELMPQPPGTPPPDGGAPKSGGPHAGGRPPTGQEPPKIVMKGKHDGNPRTTVKESR